MQVVVEELCEYNVTDGRMQREILSQLYGGKVILDSAPGQCLEHAAWRVERGSGNVLGNRAWVCYGNSHRKGCFSVVQNIPRGGEQKL